MIIYITLKITMTLIISISLMTNQFKTAENINKNALPQYSMDMFKKKVPFLAKV